MELKNQSCLPVCPYAFLPAMYTQCVCEFTIGKKEKSKNVLRRNVSGDHNNRGATITTKVNTLVGPSSGAKCQHKPPPTPPPPPSCQNHILATLHFLSLLIIILLFHPQCLPLIKLLSFNPHLNFNTHNSLPSPELLPHVPQPLGHQISLLSLFSNFTSPNFNFYAPPPNSTSFTRCRLS